MKQIAISLGALMWGLGAAAYAEPPELPSAPLDQVKPVSTQPKEDAALSPEELGELRGGETVVSQTTTQDLAAENSGNTITARRVESGDINLASDAFNGFDGIGNFVMNTGHNNNLQGSISVSIITTPPQ